MRYLVTYRRVLEGQVEIDADHPDEITDSEIPEYADEQELFVEIIDVEETDDELE